MESVGRFFTKYTLYVFLIASDLLKRNREVRRALVSVADAAYSSIYNQGDVWHSTVLLKYSYQTSSI